MEALVLNYFASSDPHPLELRLPVIGLSFAIGGGQNGALGLAVEDRGGHFHLGRPKSLAGSGVGDTVCRVHLGRPKWSLGVQLLGIGLPFGS